MEKQANDIKGEVMIFDLAQTVQAFLHAHNKPPALSFYDEMLLQKFKRDEHLKNENMVKENEKVSIFFILKWYTFNYLKIPMQTYYVCTFIDFSPK